MNLELLTKIHANPVLLDSLTAQEFEELVTTVLEALGWQISSTATENDEG